MQGLIRSKAAELLRSGTVDRVLGWKTGEFFYDVTPAVFRTCPFARTGSVTGLQPPNGISLKSTLVSKGSVSPGLVISLRSSSSIAPSNP